MSTKAVVPKFSSHPIVRLTKQAPNVILRSKMKVGETKTRSEKVNIGTGGSSIANVKIATHKAMDEGRRILKEERSKEIRLALKGPYSKLGSNCDMSTTEALLCPSPCVNAIRKLYEKNPVASYIKEKVVVNMGLSNYEFDRFLSKDNRNAQKMKDVFIYDTEISHEVIKNGNIISECVADARNLGNLRHDEGTPSVIDAWAKGLAKLSNVTVAHSIHGDDLDAAGLKLFHAVGKGAVNPPVLTVLEYIGDKSSSNTTALVGKGVTFDSGGLNLKPYGSMETMYQDKMGAMAVLGAFKAIASMKLKVNVVASVALAENAIGPDAYHPSSIIRSLKGSTVEIRNTDAEGRLILADTLTFIQNHAKLNKKVDTIIDVATLTGAIVMALGNDRAGIFSNDNKLVSNLTTTGLLVDEHVWPMPIGEEHRKAMKGTQSDLVNCGFERASGSSTAAAFLHHFVDSKIKWAHIDIAGPGCGGKASGCKPHGPQGFGVQLLTDYFRLKFM
eukprot:Tbor_TRINITY_DN5998_c2_g4::TRINITY_DN5998_c2_g4_i1::g.18170::m.18170/K01255/CARP, pepA; leucyl aminopeptidase